MDVMPEDIIAQAVRMFQRTEGAAKVGSIAVANLFAAGYRILPPDAFDLKTLEAAASVLQSRAKEHSRRQHISFQMGRDRMGEHHHARHQEALECATTIRKLNNNEASESFDYVTSVYVTQVVRNLNYYFNHPTKGLETVRVLVSLRNAELMDEKLSALVDELADSIDATLNDVGGGRSHRAILDEMLVHTKGGRP